MKQPSVILAAVDFSPASISALTQAARLASATGAALHVVSSPSSGLLHELEAFFPETGSYGADQIIDSVRERLRAILDGADAPENVGVHVTPGNAYKAIVGAIEQTRADLLVIGSTGQNGQRLGSIGGKCVRHAPIDTLIVPAGDTDPFGHITACIDFSDLSPKIVEAAALIATLDNGSITALYAHEQIDESIFIGSPPRELIERLPGAVENRFNSELAGHAGDAEITFTMTTARSYSAAIVAYAAGTKTRLVVTGTTGRSGLAYMLLGTTAEKVMREVGCAVLAVKPDA